MASSAEAIDVTPGTIEPVPAAGWPPRRVAGYGLFLLVLTSACAQLDVAIVPYLVPYIQRDLGITDVELSLLVGLSFAMFYTVIGIPIAHLVDRYSRKWILALGMITWTIGASLCGVAQNFAQLFFARFIVGGGEAVNGPAAYSLMTDLYRRERLPRAVAIYHIGQVGGPAIALLLSAWLMKKLIGMPPILMLFGKIEGWQLIFMITASPGFLIALAMLLTLREPRRQVIRNQMTAPATAGFLADYITALKYLGQHRRVFAPIFLTLLVGALSFAAAAWTPTFYLRTYGWEPAHLAVYQSVLSLVLIPIGMVLGVVLAERFTRQGRDDSPVLVLIIGRVLGLAGIFTFLMPTPELAVAISGTSAIAIGMSGPISNVQMQTVTPTEVRGKITALYLFLLNVTGIALSPILVGLLTQYVFRDPQQIRWSLFVVLGLSGPISLLFACQSRKPFIEEVRRLKALESAAS